MSYNLMDFTILDGERSVERQQALFTKGASKLDGINKKSMHNHSPSLAVDIAPYPIDWDDKYKFAILASLVFKAAAEEGVKLTWGGHWLTFKDMPHFELTRDGNE